MIEGTHLLVAGGRTPNTDGIGLEKAGVETDEKGHVKVDAGWLVAQGFRRPFASARAVRGSSGQECLG